MKYRKTQKLLRLKDNVGHTSAAYNFNPTLIAFRHNGRWNASYLDGHVDLIGRDLVSDPNSYW